MGESRQKACSVALGLARLNPGTPPEVPIKNSLRSARGKHNFLLPVSPSALWPKVGETVTHVMLLGFYTLRA